MRNVPCLSSYRNPYFDTPLNSPHSAGTVTRHGSPTLICGVAFNSCVPRVAAAMRMINMTIRRSHKFLPNPLVHVIRTKELAEAAEAQRIVGEGSDSSLRSE